jgi:hypothetical protein
VIPPPSSLPNTNDSVKSLPAITPIIPKPQPVAPKLEFAPIESFEKVTYFIICFNCLILILFQENQERPSLDLFSAIFDNQDSDDENVDEQEEEKKKNDNISKPTSTQSSFRLGPSIALPSVSSIPQRSHDSDQSESSDSSIEEIEFIGKIQT